jgi:outer membrane protein insertion porin family
VETTIHVDAREPARVGPIEFAGGTETFSPEELLDALDVETGDRFFRRAVFEGTDEIRADFAALGFLNTQVRAEERYEPSTNTTGLRVVIEPGPFTYVDVRGFAMSQEEIRELFPVFQEGSVDTDLIDEGRLVLVERLRREGYFEADVASQFIEVPFENAYQINYNVVPGPQYSVEEVVIEGNTFLSDDLLHERIGISREGVFSRGVFSPDLLDDATETIRLLYDAAGYADCEVGAAYRADGSAITVTISIDEGERLTIGDVRFTGNTAIDDTTLVLAAGFFRGQAYTPGLARAGRSAVVNAYHERGYPDVRVRNSIAATSDGQIDLDYDIVEGPPFRVGRILVAGNTRTQEKIVHRNAEVFEGDPYDPEAILESQRELYATGLFSRVDIVNLDRERGNVRDILIQIEESSPILLTYGVGAQDREGVRGTVEITHSNLFGLERSLSARVRGSRREKRFQTTYREPRLFNWELDGFASLFVERTRQIAYDATRVDFSVQTLREYSEDINFLVSASYQTVNLQDVRVNPRADDPEFADEEGIIQIARVTGSYVHDTRDDILDPAGGNYFIGTVQLANRALGSEINFASLFTQASVFRPARGGVLVGSARFGWNQPYGGTSTLPITERYFAGGSTTLRSFGLDDAGSGLGGNALVILNVEYRFGIPFFLDGLGGASFYDTGTVFDDISDFSVGDFTHTLGFGLRYRTPIGPIRVDYGVNVNRQPGERSGNFTFTLGHAF